jgi:long-chain acyl-CoA synthetase
MIDHYDRSDSVFTEKNLNAYISNSLISNWDMEAFTDYKGATLLYRDVARRIAKLHIMFEEAGLKPGDRIALCGKNSSNWGTACLAALTYGAVVVPILHEFKSDNIHHIINHSETKLFFAGDQIWENLNEASMPNVEGIITLDEYQLVISRNEKLTYAREHLNELFGRKYPREFTKADVKYFEAGFDDMAMINYTSGSTGFSKGVMLPYRSLISNHLFARKALYVMKPGDKVISMLPMAHMYGFAFEFMHEFLMGCHVYFLTRLPSPKIIFQALSEIKPTLIVSVPLVIEKIIKKNILPKLETPSMKLLLKVPILNDQIKKKVCEEMIKGFGGNFYEVILGGAPFNQEVERFVSSIHFPYTVGYGATECAPIIAYDDKNTFAPGSCGKPVPNMEVKILSADPEHVPGEIICRGPNVMLGYYKNEKLTEETIDKDGWMYTGDLGIMDKEGNIFIKGRSKSMILGPSGQNIYPEEIEAVVNNQDYVLESVVVDRGGKLVALVYLDQQAIAKDLLDGEAVSEIPENIRKGANRKLPNYSQLTKVEPVSEPFEKTPKMSIKRFLYK